MELEVGIVLFRFYFGVGFGGCRLWGVRRWVYFVLLVFRGWFGCILVFEGGRGIFVSLEVLEG